MFDSPPSAVASDSLAACHEEGGEAWACGDRDATDEPSFSVLAERHADLVYRLAHRITGSVADAEEVRQTVFLSLLRNRPKGVSDWRAWLCRCAAE
ncbi:MAG: sigma factor, partial [Planctomycetota bacterium]